MIYFILAILLPFSCHIAHQASCSFHFQKCCRNIYDLIQHQTCMHAVRQIGTEYTHKHETSSRCLIIKFNNFPPLPPNYNPISKTPYMKAKADAPIAPANTQPATLNPLASPFFDDVALAALPVAVPVLVAVPALASSSNPQMPVPFIW